jgi:hypothetical protein
MLSAAMAWENPDAKLSQRIPEIDDRRRVDVWIAFFHTFPRIKRLTPGDLNV